VTVACLRQISEEIDALSSQQPRGTRAIGRDPAATLVATSMD